MAVLMNITWQTPSLRAVWKISMLSLGNMLWFNKMILFSDYFNVEFMLQVF